MTLTSYLVETYVPRVRADDLAAAAARAGAAARSLAGEGQRIRFLRATFVPADELWLLAFEAESPALVAEATARAEIAYDRILEAVE